MHMCVNEWMLIWINARNNTFLNFLKIFSIYKLNKLFRVNKYITPKDSKL